MFIITKTTAAARPVSLEQISAMVIVQQRFEFIAKLSCWRWQKQQKQQQRLSMSCCRKNLVLLKNPQNYNNSDNNSSMDNRQQLQQPHHQPKFSQPFIVIAVMIALVLFANCPAFVVAASKTAIRSIATSNHENDPNRLHANWLDYQRQTLRSRQTQSTAGSSPPAAAAAAAISPNHNYLSPDLGNIFQTLGILIQARQRNATELAQHIFFKYFNTEGDLLYESNFSKPHDLHVAQCYPSGRFAILLHGWRESCNTTWMKQLIRKIGTFRGGCIICMDYSRYAAESYVRLVRVFDPIAQILTMQLHLLDYMGFDMNNGYLFGFSYGGQLATEAGRRIGHRRLKEIDTCDMAGPGFDHRSNQPNHREAAQNVQCIHTSRDKGTRFYNCHQDWRLGNCGLTQVASNSPPLGSHGLCPYMYVNAFEHDFYAIIKPDDCVSKRMATYWPPKFKMGYMEKRKWQVSGELFAHTSKYHPFNIISNTTDSSKEIVYRDIATPDVLQPNSNVLQKLKERILRYVFQDQFFH